MADGADDSQNREDKSEMISKSNEDEPMENGESVSNSHQFEDDDNITEEDFHTLNSQLDALNSALDALEHKNDNIHAQLVELLQSNREARQQFQETVNEEDPGQSGTRPTNNS